MASGAPTGKASAPVRHETGPSTPRLEGDGKIDLPWQFEEPRRHLAVPALWALEPGGLSPQRESGVFARARKEDEIQATCPPATSRRESPLRSNPRAESDRLAFGAGHG